jgi:hypothetical protein
MIAGSRSTVVKFKIKTIVLFILVSDVFGLLVGNRLQGKNIILTNKE